MFTRSLLIALLLVASFSNAEEKIQMCGSKLALYMDKVDCSELAKVEKVAVLGPKQLLINCCSASGCSHSEVVRAICRK